MISVGALQHQKLMAEGKDLSVQRHPSPQGILERQEQRDQYRTEDMIRSLHVEPAEAQSLQHESSF